MIRNFADQETERVSNGERSRKLPPDIQQTARRKLREIGRARKPADFLPHGETASNS